MKKIVWSYGGGRQSAAIAVLIVEGAIPKPDIAVIADTGREISATWDYLRDYIQPYLNRVGLTIEIASHDMARVDLYDRNGDTLLIPAYTTQSGKLGKLPTYCSSEWKKHVVRRWLRAKGVKKCEIWLGMSADEQRRVKESGKKWIENRYPLSDLGISTNLFLELVDKAGLPPAPKSACWMCPHRNASGWQAMKRDHPEDFEKAAQFQDEIQEQDPDVWITQYAQPLYEIEFDKEPKQRQREFLFGSCESGYCWT